MGIHLAYCRRDTQASSTPVAGGVILISVKHCIVPRPTNGCHDPAHVAFSVTLRDDPPFYSTKQESELSLLGELVRPCALPVSAWLSEAGGGKTFCLSMFLGGVVLSRPQPCCPLLPPADNRYVTFYVTFCVAQKSEPSWLTRGKQGLAPSRANKQWVDSTSRSCRGHHGTRSWAGWVML